jgi:hypothetical protein
MNTIDYRRSGSNQIETELPLQPFLNDFHVQETEEAAAESEAESQ